MRALLGQVKCPHRRSLCQSQLQGFLCLLLRQPPQPLSQELPWFPGLHWLHALASASLPHPAGSLSFACEILAQISASRHEQSFFTFTCDAGCGNWNVAARPRLLLVNAHPGWRSHMVLENYWVPGKWLCFQGMLSMWPWKLGTLNPMWFSFFVIRDHPSVRFNWSS
jgi:hypothetical protein